MTFDPNKPVQTRDGRAARILSSSSNHKFEDTPQPIVAEIMKIDGGWAVESYCEDGHYLPDRIGPRDLINVPDSEPLTDEEMDKLVGQKIRRKETGKDRMVIDRKTNSVVVGNGSFYSAEDLLEYYTYPDGCSICKGSLD